MVTTRKVLYGGGHPGCQITTGVSASAAVVTGSGVFFGLLMKCDGTNDVVLNVFDSASAAGTKLIPTDLVFDGTVLANALSFAPGVNFDTGLYLEIAVAGGGATEIQLLYILDDISSVH